MEFKSFNRQYGKTLNMIKQAVKSALENPESEIRIFGHISVKRTLYNFLSELPCASLLSLQNIKFIERAVLSEKDFEMFNINFNVDFVDHHLLENTLKNRDWEIYSKNEAINKLQNELNEWKLLAKSYKDLFVKTDKMLDSI